MQQSIENNKVIEDNQLTNTSHRLTIEMTTVTQTNTMSELNRDQVRVTYISTTALMSL
ncbi:hypothetical protein Q4508_10540 [Amphritea sp. 2_MG-2023]|uniref:hypothetical protein n=1 Tax=Amphritea sp. 2_MG-2023 TaxID=3062682 RepID=UPI0026E269CE|nr:hypothetical protein [Amphritea sp. 2_MG-2023]MDO6418996.1 hypothetical protein [Amphritea sp. 2_MG-2023]